MKNLFIPPLGSVITLAEDWTFDLWHEDRNESLATAMNITWQCNSWRDHMNEHLPITIPAGTKLTIDRIYIRKGQDDFDSVTFVWKGNVIPARVEQGIYRPFKIPAKTVRFWAKLNDVNRIKLEDE